MALNLPMSRRRVLACTGAATLFLLSSCSSPARSASAARGTKLIFVLLRGAADGLALLAPVGDPRFESARGALAEEDGRHQVDAFFALHPELEQTAKLAGQGQALLFHAVGLSRPTRSHFDAQNLLETGGTQPYREETGVLNRLLGLAGKPETGLALAQAVPPAMRGPRPVSSYGPDNSKGVDADLYGRIAGMYDENDPRLAAVWQQAVETRTAAMAASQGLSAETNRIGSLAASFLTPPDGYDLAMIESLGWDTHSNQRGRLARQAKELDALIGALRTGMGEHWRDTLVIVVSEFGRSVSVNGNGGSDHGTGGALFAVGGSLPRSGVIADWPGLARGQLLENRDLRTTVPVEGVLATLAAAHFGIEPVVAVKSLYPGLDGLAPYRL